MTMIDNLFSNKCPSCRAILMRNRVILLMMTKLMIVPDLVNDSELSDLDK